MLGCAGTSDYVYTPNTSNATAAGLPASRTLIPPERPQGSIEVLSYGATRLNRDDARIPALHVRAIVSNDSDDSPWTFDTTQQLVEIAGEGRSRAIFANADVGTLPIVTIGRSEKRTVDLYFPLPETMRDEKNLAGFDLVWQVNTPARAVASRTSFDRVEQKPEYQAGYAVGYGAWPWYAGYGPYWWYDPFYPRVVFLHSRPIIVRPGRVQISPFHGQFKAGHTQIATRRR
jgi:hypothetical protein